METISRSELHDLFQRVEHKISLYDGEYSHSVLLEIEMDEYLLVEVHPPRSNDGGLKITRLVMEDSEDEPTS